MPSSDTAPFVVRNEDVYDLIGLGYGEYSVLAVSLDGSDRMA